MQMNGPSWAVPTGRRDGRVSLASDVTNLPSFVDSVDVQKKKFADLGLNTLDLVALVGEHYNLSPFPFTILECKSWRPKCVNITACPNLVIFLLCAGVSKGLHWVSLYLTNTWYRRAHHRNWSLPGLQVQTLQLHHYYLQWSWPLHWSFLCFSTPVSVSTKRRRHETRRPRHRQP